MTPELARVLGEAAMPDLSDTQALKDRIAEATAIVHKYMHPSPMRYSTWLSEELGMPVWLKLECLNPNGSFKVRGALSAIHQRLQTHDASKGPLKVCAASAGNHAQGVALAAKLMGCEAHIFLPKRTPLVKRSATERLGASVYLVGDVLEDAFEAALEFAKTQGAEFLHAFNDFDVVVGQATCAVEVLEQFAQECPNVPLSDVDFICCVGGGGLAAGAGLVFKLFGAGKVYGAEQEFFDSAARSLHEHKRLPVTHFGKNTIADGIAVGLIGNVNFSILSQTLERMLLVSDDDIVAALLGLVEREHVVAEAAGAAALAAARKNPGLFTGRHLVLSVSGGNIDPQMLSRVITRGLGVTGRMIRLTARISDRPGQLKTLLEKIASVDANVLEVYHDRTYAQVNVGDVEVELALETRGFEHQYELLEVLEEAGFGPRIRH
ncbi:pyridoxal-phosphate dependent enzyme [bacterium]|nr:pyridoxal-phosphate dependent enzyme [bacterium]